MPESKVRRSSAEKKKKERHDEAIEARAEKAEKKAVAGPGSRRWVAPTFIIVGLLGVIWLVLFYIAGSVIPGMNKLGNWNILIGMGLMACSLGISMLWK